MTSRMRHFVIAGSTAAALVGLPAGGLAFPQPPQKREPAASAAVDAPRADSAAVESASTARADSTARDSTARDSTAAPASNERRRAEALYAKGYEESRRAADLEASGKAKEARKEYERALGRFDEAVRLDERYFEAWNMLGYCARKTGDLRRSFDAYDRCLALRPDYEPAHEYRGEGYLQNGEIEKAKGELQWLRERKSAQADLLEAAIEAAEKGKAGSTGPGGSW